MIAFVDTSTSRAASHQRAESANQGITTRRRSPEGDADLGQSITEANAGRIVEQDEFDAELDALFAKRA
jgi:hypothetical protein